MLTTGPYPTTRLRRLRNYQWSRELVAEYSLSVSDLIWPLFVCDTNADKYSIPSMPDIKIYTLSTLPEALKLASSLGIKAISLFPIINVNYKCSKGLESKNKNNILCQAIRMIKCNYPGIGIITDVALDPYTTHGQDGLVVEGEIINDDTIDLLIECALAQAKAGSDVIAPSDMMDGRVGLIRSSLDKEGFNKTMILSYTAKYASSFYGPFRQVVGSASCLDINLKSTYQMHTANRHEALREGLQDIKEGADILMVKPGLIYLDIIRDIKSHFHMPTFAYHVSGEYAMLKSASQNGLLDYDRAIMEIMLSFKRAGADGILTYAACHVASLLKTINCKN